MSKLMVRGIAAVLVLLGFATASSAASLYLTSSGLGMSAGNHGHELDVTDWLTLTGRSLVGSYLLPDGVDGTLYVAAGDAGVGVRGEHGEGTFQIAGDSSMGMECLEFNLRGTVQSAGMEVGLNRFSFGSDELFVQVWDGDGSVHSISDVAALQAAYIPERADQGRLNLGLLFDDVTQVERVSVQATRGTFYINKFAVSVIDPVPEPASLWLLGSGLLGAFGVGRLRRRRSL
jgi:hypothetical protein